MSKDRFSSVPHAAPTFQSIETHPRDTSTLMITFNCTTPQSTQPAATCSNTKSITCLHLYARIHGGYPKLGLFCNDDLEVDSDTEVTIMEGPRDEDIDSEDEISFTQEETHDNTSPSDRDGNREFVPAPASRSLSKVYSRSANLDSEVLTPSCEEDATSRVGVKRPVDKKKDGPILVVTGPDSTRASNVGDVPRADQSPLSSTKRRKYHSVEGSADEAVGDDVVFSEQDSDDEYIPGSTWRAKCMTKVGRKESKSLKNGPLANPPAKSVGPALKVNTTIMKHPSRQRPAYNKRKDRQAAIPPSSRRNAEKRESVEDPADEVVHDGFPAYSGSRSCRERGFSDSNHRSSRNLQHGTTALGFQGNKRQRVDGISESSLIDVGSGLFDDSDEECTPGPPSGRSVRRTKTKTEINKSKKSGARGGISSSASHTNKRHKGDIEESWPGGAGSPTGRNASETSTRSDSEVQETGEERDLADLTNVVRESGGYRCLDCDKYTKSKGDMKRHLQSIRHQVKSYVCFGECLSTFTRKDSLKRHIENKHKGETVRIDVLRNRAYRVRNLNELE